MKTAETTIPYEKQSDPQSGRMCGAACLSMVYRSLRKEVPQAQIWPEIAKQNRFGSLASTTHLMVSNAHNLGFSSVAIQARHPLQALRICRERDIRAILNHRLQRDMPTGHYSVLVDIDDTSVVLHDPFFGPFRRLPHDELLELWQPSLPNSEIVGNSLIAVAAAATAISACQLCRAPMPPQVACPKCGKPVSLQPDTLLGCLNNACGARMWNYICCPACDYTWTFSLQSPHPGSSAVSAGMPDSTASSEAGEKALDLNRLFAELDKFCNHIMSLPAAANHPDIKSQIAFIAASKEKLKLAQAEQRVYLKAHQEQLAALVQAAKQKEDAYRQQMAELNRQTPPLDGNALGRALLKNLGFIN